MNAEAAQQLLGRLREQAREVYRLSAGLSETQLALRQEPGQWSLKELICHLWRVQQVFARRIEFMLSEDNPEIEPYEPDLDAEFDRMAKRPAADLLSSFIADRQRLLKRLQGLAAAEWERSGRHPEYPHFSVRFQIEYMAHHEAHHIYQMFQRRALLSAPPR